MRSVILLLVNALFFCSPCLGQRELPVVNPNLTIPNIGSAIRGVTQGRFGKLNIEDVNYSEVSGSPFWNPEWQSAVVYIDDIRKGRLSVKLNLVTGELYFLKDSKELILTGVNVTRLVFDKIPEPAIFISRVPDLRLKNQDFEGFVQVMNSGDYELLKYTERKVIVADSVMRVQKLYTFYDHVYYFLKSNNKVYRIKKKSKESFLSHLPGASSFNEWIAESQIDFGKEADMIRFLRHYNSQRKAPL